MKTKNFVILRVLMLIVGVLFGCGCGAVRTGDNSFQYGTFPLGGNASSTKIVIANYTSGLMDVYWDNVKINREADKKTYKPIRPGEIFVYENNTAWVGEQVSLNVQIWDISHSRILGYGARVFPVHFRRGVVSINWTFRQDGDRIRNYIEGGYGGFGRYR